MGVVPQNLGEIIKMQNKKLKVVWLSANEFGYELLCEAMKLKTIAVTAIITLSSKATTKMHDGIDSEDWSKFNVPIYEIENINEKEVLLQAFDPDVVMMCGWRQIIDKKILDIPRLGFIGFHPTILPKGRGSAPIINTILSGVKESGVTMFYADEGLDSGDIIGIERFNVGDDDYATDVYDKVIEAGKALVKTYLPLIAEGKAPRTPQPEEEATYLPKRTLKDNEIHLEESEEIYKKIRAFSHPYNGAFIRIGDKKLIIWNAELEDTIEEEGEEKKKTNLAILISGRGSNLKAIIDAIQSGYLAKVDLKVVVANKYAEGLKYASEAGIPAHIVSRKYHPGSEERDLNKHDKLVMDILEEYDIDLIALAGYDQILQKEFVNKYLGRIMNIHPSLLPSFKNTLHAQEEALDYGVKISGCTVHFVVESVDTGQILIQRAVPVRDDDTPETLADRILKHEHVIYPEAIKLFSEIEAKADTSLTD